MVYHIFYRELRNSFVPGHLLAMVDALQAGTLNPAQQEMVQTLRAAIMALAE